jgi:hypothetical protein
MGTSFRTIGRPKNAGVPVIHLRPSPGPHICDTSLARAKDAKGSVQPDKHDQNYDTYVIDHRLPIEVFVD